MIFMVVFALAITLECLDLNEGLHVYDLDLISISSGRIVKTIIGEYILMGNYFTPVHLSLQYIIIYVCWLSSACFTLSLKGLSCPMDTSSYTCTYMYVYIQVGLALRL